MSILLLVPGLISLYLVLRGRVETAFLSVYLPCLLLLPQEYALRIPHLPPTSASEFAVIPLGVLGLVRLIRRRSFLLMDLFVILYTASIGLSEVLHAPVLNDALFTVKDAFVAQVLTYLVGRELIEPDLRFATMRRFVVLVLLDFPSGLFEWRMGQNLYGIFAQRVLGLTTMGENVQIRGGHGRMSDPFSNSEEEGIVFAMTFCLNAGLLYLRRVKSSVDLGQPLFTLEKYHVPELILVLSVWLTQARGPLIAMGAGYLILQIPRFKNTRLMTFVVAAVLVAGYMAASAYFESYTNTTSAVSEQQGSVMYRREMNRVYTPIAEAGGWTGWTALGIPHVEGMVSIDNQYLLVHLAWGRIGYILFVLIVGENMRVLLMRSWQFESLEDRAFVFFLMAAMAVLWFTIYTVYMGGQLPQIAFLLIGWIQSIVPNQAATSSGTQIALNESDKFAFRRVFG
jgi:hypothetical protein